MHLAHLLGLFIRDLGSGIWRRNKILMLLKKSKHIWMGNDPQLYSVTPQICSQILYQ